MLFHGALVDDMNDTFLDEFLEYPPACFLTLEENLAGMISAHDYHSEIRSVKVNVHVEQEFLGDSRDTDWGPGFPILHGRVRIDVVHQHSDIYPDVKVSPLPYGFMVAIWVGSVNTLMTLIDVISIPHL